ncbi:unnamed protein product [Durusdinium trenchii]|uniref:Transglutaminase-like domain-containing protein n=2 Tax=Durusdinium trenchii TaxID=1381693 RepID=A0ABP0KUS3_9DINO
MVRALLIVWMLVTSGVAVRMGSGGADLEADDESFAVGDMVLIQTGKYKSCQGEVIQISSSSKVKVRRRCGDGRKGDGKTWWYKPGQVEEIDDSEEEEEPVEPQEALPDISLIMDDDFRSKHKLCDRYKDLPPVDPRATPPRLNGRPVVRRGQSFRLQLQLSATKSADVRLLQGGQMGKAELRGGEIHVEIPAWAPVGEYEVLALDSKDATLATFGFIVIFNPFSCPSCPEYSDQHQEYLDGNEGLLFQGLSDHYTANHWYHEPFRAANLLIALKLLDWLPMMLRGDLTAVTRYLTNAVGDKVCFGKWGEGDYAGGKPDGGYKCRSKKYVKRRAEKWAHTCHDPTSWTSSSPILEKHWGLVQSGVPSAVQYCQCFVFSGVLTTIGRTLGIATRSVTNFQSAHDVNSDRGVSKFFFTTPTGVWEPVEFSDTLCPAWCESAKKAKKKKCNLKRCSSALRRGVGFTGRCKACIPCVPCESREDSIWSFHVWNEMYYARGNGQEWQALDATPQEMSGGKFQMGPASVPEVRHGKSDCYDTDFVIGEVNGDTKLYVYQVPNLDEDTKQKAIEKGEFMLHSGDPLFLGIRWYMDPFGDPYNTVGYKVVTKKPGQIAKSCWKNPSDCQDEELDLTPSYKQCPHAEGRQPFCAAGYSKTKPQCAEPGADEESLLQQEDEMFQEGNSSYQVVHRSLHELTGDSDDVKAEFSAFVPKTIELDHDLPLQITFTNTGSEQRTLRIAITSLGCDYRGMPVITMQTRRKKYAMKLPLDGLETLLQREVELGPRETKVFQHVVPAENLSGELLETLEVNAAEGTFFLQFHVSAHVLETGQTFGHQPRRHLVEAGDA